jgi:hypothetical protein
MQHTCLPNFNQSQDTVKNTYTYTCGPGMVAWSPSYSGGHRKEEI